MSFSQMPSAGIQVAILYSINMYTEHFINKVTSGARTDVTASGGVVKTPSEEAACSLPRNSLPR